MPQAPQTTLTNNFIGGLKTEFTGLNFPENSATDTDNCIYTLIGEVTRRAGFDYEKNFVQTTVDPTGKALSKYKWNNVGGDGSTQIVVQQIGNILNFYKSSSATTAMPLSATKLISSVNLSLFIVAGSTADPSVTECQYADGNGYLFVYHPVLEPFYCTFNADVVTPNQIVVKVRDFNGVPEPGVDTNVRPSFITVAHNYNLINQGWTQGNLYFANDNVSTYGSSLGIAGFSVEPGLANVVNGQVVNIVNKAIGGVATGVVVGYVGTLLTINVTAIYYPGFTATGGWTIYPLNASLIDTWHSQVGNYPSNADVWWRFKDTTGTFKPLTTVSGVTLGSGPAPKGFCILNAFNEQRSIAGGVVGITPINTNLRPTTGTWFQGRVWYTGVNASAPAAGNHNYYTWTENIYFSQTITDTTQFGFCYQTNDPTSESLFDLLPTDGGIITIQGSGSIYKLFPIQNGLLVFAANGIWFITGSQGIGFAANDYTITKISSVQSISSTSFVNVLGFPMFWNEEGIYTVIPSQQGGGLSVENLAIGTILSFYSEIPLESKKFARGDYNPVDFVVQWVFRSTDGTTVTSKYQFDKILNINTSNKAFYPYSFSGNVKLHDVIYVAGPGGSASPDPVFKYLVSDTLNKFTFAEENNFKYVDWFAFDGVGVDYNSFFVTGYRIHGQGTRKWQPGYLYMYTSNNSSYKIQNIWDYANTPDSGRWSAIQLVTNFNPNYDINIRRHRLRGHGYVNQIKVISMFGKPFNIQGWTVYELQNTGV